MYFNFFEKFKKLSSKNAMIWNDSNYYYKDLLISIKSNIQHINPEH